MTHIADTILILCLILLVRNYLVDRILQRRLREVHDRNEQAINAGCTDLDSLCQEYRCVDDYYKMVFDLTKWTYKGFFPDNLEDVK